MPESLASWSVADSRYEFAALGFQIGCLSFLLRSRGLWGGCECTWNISFCECSRCEICEMVLPLPTNSIAKTAPSERDELRGKRLCNSLTFGLGVIPSYYRPRWMSRRVSFKLSRPCVQESTCNPSCYSRKTVPPRIFSQSSLSNLNFAYERKWKEPTSMRKMTACCLICLWLISVAHVSSAGLGSELTKPILLWVNWKNFAPQ